VLELEAQGSRSDWPVKQSEIRDQPAPARR
jgi:hypothetical protein